MAGDYTRFTFGPQRDYSGIFKQQGRVDLDADFNELIEIVDRRWRSETIDIIGHCIVPNTTPDAFLVIPTSIGDFDIGIGRMYVDGIQVENHGRPPLDYQADLGEMRGATLIPYSDQPYLPAPLPPDLVAASGTTDLVYIDVWQREVTALEDPSLREIALGGPDTTTRTQSVWQIRALENVGAHGCGDDIAAWDQLVAPSAGRLTTSAVAPPTSDDPCIISPSGGYRGLENRLYRVEIHSIGPIGGGAPAKFKWSRNNATIASSVSTIPSGTAIIVQQIGRDQVLRFRIGDWVEITDDFREFQGLAGHMAQITGIDEANRVIRFNPAISGTINFNAADPTRHTRVRRWDQTQNVDANGLLDVVAGLINIEDGIRATFTLDPAGGSFKIGDYWVFAARTADGSVEILQNAPPRGILHHFCRLGFIRWGTTLPGTTFTDCREHWPPAFAGCCTVTVMPGENIQAALDSLPAVGGCVCLKVGEHLISQPLRIEKSNVTLHGETLGAHVVRNNGATLFLVGHPDGLLLEKITVSGIHFEFQNKGVREAELTPLVAIDRCHHTKVEGCVVEAQELRNLVGIRIGRSTGVEISYNRLSQATLGIWVVSDTTLVSARRNVLTATTANNSDGGIIGIFFMDAFGPSVVEENSIAGFLFGIAVNKGLFAGTPLSLARGSVIAGNRILRLNGQTEMNAAKAFAIDVAADDCTIRDNYLIYGADDYAGISVSGANAYVERNRVRSLAKEVSATPSVGILLARLGPQGSLGSVGGKVVGNSILGAQDGVLLIGNDRAEVLDNCIESEGGEGRFAIGLLASSRIRVYGNRITNMAFPIVAIGGTANEIACNTLFRGGGGATLLNQASMEFTQNRVEDMRNYGLIALQGLAKFAIVENRFLSSGYAQVPAIGIGVSQHFGELHIESNEVMDTGVSPDSATISTLAWGIFANLVLEARVQSNNVTYANAALLDVNQEHRALWLRGFLEQVIDSDHQQIVFGFSAQVLDNKFLGPGRSALVEIAQQAVTDNIFLRFERVFFNNNFCWHASVASQAAATVSLFGRSAIVMGNHIKTNVSIPSVDFHGIKDAVYMGNIAQKGPANFGGIPTSVSGFNKP